MICLSTQFRPGVGREESDIGGERDLCQHYRGVPRPDLAKASLLRAPAAKPKKKTMRKAVIEFVVPNTHAIHTVSLRKSEMTEAITDTARLLV